MCLWSQGRETPVKCEVLNEEMYAKESRGSGVVVTPFFPILQGGRYYIEAIYLSSLKKNQRYGIGQPIYDPQNPTSLSLVPIHFYGIVKF